MRKGSRPKKAPDMETIADRLGVSKTTVHYALRNTGRVSAKMREKVRSLAKELGYRPNRLARSLRTKQSDTLGVIFVSLTTTYQSRVLDGLENTAQEKEFGLLLANSHASFQTEQRLVELFLEKGIDGLVLAPCGTGEQTKQYLSLIEQGVKLVFIDREVPGVSVDAVTSDHRLGGRLAAEHLISLGRRSFAFLAPKSHSRDVASVVDRRNAFVETVQKHGCRSPIILGEETPDEKKDAKFAYQVMKGFLDSRRKPIDALFASHDGLAFGALRAMADAGVRVPRDVSVVGYDDQDSAAFTLTVNEVNNPTILSVARVATVN